MLAHNLVAVALLICDLVDPLNHLSASNLHVKVRLNYTRRGPLDFSYVAPASVDVIVHPDKSLTRTLFRSLYFSTQLFSFKRTIWAVVLSQ
jgi:hypothetical protein